MTLTVVGADPLKAMELGETVHVDCAGALVQVSDTIWLVQNRRTAGEDVPEILRSLFGCSGLLTVSRDLASRVLNAYRPVLLRGEH